MSASCVPNQIYFVPERNALTQEFFKTHVSLFRKMTNLDLIKHIINLMNDAFLAKRFDLVIGPIYNLKRVTYVLSEFLKVDTRRSATSSNVLCDIPTHYALKFNSGCISCLLRRFCAN